jgi:hypothetical protein
MAVVLIPLLQKIRNILRKESASNIKECYFLKAIIRAIFKLSFLMYSVFLLRLPHFHVAERSLGHHVYNM